MGEGMDGLDLHPARQVQHLGEQGAGAAHRLGRGRLAGEVGEIARELLLRGCRPVAEAAREPCSPSPPQPPG
ncbi:MAG: hypothetical protein RML45_00465 [Acetobacteraceae bacterium]|nr:hypothetical protein [Acetobacteraceae bacterium]